jgi:Predicted transcriptional regulators
MKNRLKEIREEQGFSQEELAEISGVSSSIISEIENDRSEVTKTDTLVKLADALDSKVSEMFFWSDSPIS